MVQPRRYSHENISGSREIRASDRKRNAPAVERTDHRQCPAIRKDSWCSPRAILPPLTLSRRAYKSWPSDKGRATPFSRVAAVSAIGRGARFHRIIPAFNTLPKCTPLSPSAPLTSHRRFNIPKYERIVSSSAIWYTSACNFRLVQYWVWLIPWIDDLYSFSFAIMPHDFLCGLINRETSNRIIFFLQVILPVSYHFSLLFKYIT